MHERWHTTNTLHIPSSQLLSRSDDAGDNCIVSRHVVCSLCLNQTPGTISHSPDIQEDSVATSNYMRMVGWSCCGDVLTYFAFPEWKVSIFIKLLSTLESDGRINKHSANRHSNKQHFYTPRWCSVKSSSVSLNALTSGFFSSTSIRATVYCPHCRVTTSIFGVSCQMSADYVRGTVC